MSLAYMSATPILGSQVGLCELLYFIVGYYQILFSSNNFQLKDPIKKSFSFIDENCFTNIIELSNKTSGH